MKVVCRANSGSQLAQHYKVLGPFPQARANLTIDREYLVVAMSLWESRLNVLVADDNGRPKWYALELFSTSDNHIPDEWLFASTPCDSQPDLRAVWGYEELILDPGHYVALMEGDYTALIIFNNERQRLLELDEPAEN